MDHKVPNGQPLEGKILIKLLPKKEKTKSGLIIADVALNPLIEATIIDISPEHPYLVQFDKILIPNGCGVEHEIEGVKYKFITITDPFYLIGRRVS